MKFKFEFMWFVNLIKLNKEKNINFNIINKIIKLFLYIYRSILIKNS